MLMFVGRVSRQASEMMKAGRLSQKLPDWLEDYTETHSTALISAA